MKKLLLVLAVATVVVLGGCANNGTPATTEATATTEAAVTTDATATTAEAVSPAAVETTSPAAAQ